MAADDWILVLDQGTTSTRALVFDGAGRRRAAAARPLRQIYPRPGWVEHDPEEIWRAAAGCMREAFEACGADGRRVAAVGIANQRETTLLWDRRTGAPLANAIVWQDRRAAAECARLADAGHGETVARLSGLVLDPYFSATKLRRLLDERAAGRDPATLAFGTVDSFLLWRLTAGRVHATDATNAARTMLFDIRRLEWSEELLALFGVPRPVLPEVRPTAGAFGVCGAGVFGRALPVTAMAGDQHAALVGQGCLAPGAMKCTYGTGAFAMAHMGAAAPVSRRRLLATLAWRLESEAAYALEGAIFNAGSVVQWLRDGLGVLRCAAESAALAARADPESAVTMVPAFTGLGAPHWDAGARGAIFGLTRGAGPAELARAALDSVCFQTADLVAAMRADGAAPESLRIDGGMARNRWFAQRLADILALPVARAGETEATALGAALLARLGAGLADGLALPGGWRPAERLTPRLDAPAREAALARWADAVARTRSGGGGADTGFQSGSHRRRSGTA